MSDEEIYYLSDEENNEYDVAIQKELISLVKANPALYTKNSKEYAGKNFCKDLTWKNIGCSLSKPISGKDAAKMWYNIRQRFGRERRKVVAALKGKSGQETKPLYVPKWSLYSLCSFLIDHIMPRKTVSNYTSKKNIKKTIAGITSTSPVFILPSPSASSSITPNSIEFPYVSPPQQAISSQVFLQASSLQPSSQMLTLKVRSPQALAAQID